MKHTGTYSAYIDIKNPEVIQLETTSDGIRFGCDLTEEYVEFLNEAETYLQETLQSMTSSAVEYKLVNVVVTNWDSVNSSHGLYLKFKFEYSFEYSFCIFFIESRVIPSTPPTLLYWVGHDMPFTTDEEKATGLSYEEAKELHAKIPGTKHIEFI